MLVYLVVGCCGYNSRLITMCIYKSKKKAEKKLFWLRSVWPSDKWYIIEYELDSGFDISQIE